MGTTDAYLVEIFFDFCTTHFTEIQDDENMQSSVTNRVECFKYRYSFIGVFHFNKHKI